MANVVWTVAAYPVGIASLSLYLHKYAHPLRCCRIYILRPIMTHGSCVRFRPFLISIFVPINMHMSVYMQRAYLYRYIVLNSAYIDVFYIHIFIAQDEYTGNTTWSWVRCQKGIPLHNAPVDTTLLWGTLHEKNPAPIPSCCTLRDTRWEPPGAATGVG